MCPVEQTRPKSIPEPSLRRLPLYHRVLKGLEAAGRLTVSCTEIGAELKEDPTLVRKDLEAAGIVGRPRVGYVLTEILGGLETFLGWNNANEAFLVGVGGMGSALLGYGRFEQCGLRIVAAFDVDPAKVNGIVHGKHVLPLGELVDLAGRMKVLIGIITVPASEAQGVADLMVEGGIRAIWNFAPVHLRLPEQIIVHNEDLQSSLASLSQKLSQAIKRHA